MLTGRKVAFVGGDARILEVIKYVIELDASPLLIGFDDLDEEFAGASKVDLNPEVFEDIDAVVLPVAGLDEEGTLESKYAAERIQFGEEYFSAMPRRCQVFTGIARNYLTDLCSKYRLHLVKLMELDEVAILNSIPTAEGAVQLAMENTDFTIHGSRVAVLGFGRCGVTLARTLHSLGAKVRVGARKPPDLARVFEFGLDGFHMNDIQGALHDVDIIFNTVPAPVLTAEVLAKVPRSCVVIDIASNPGGTDFRYADKRGIKALLAPSLPGIVAPKTAGKIIAQTLCRYLLEHA